MADIEALEAKMAKLREKRDEVVAELKEVTAQRNALQNEQLADELLSGMNENQRAAIIHAASVESTAKVGRG